MKSAFTLFLSITSISLSAQWKWVYKNVDSTEIASVTDKISQKWMRKNWPQFVFVPTSNVYFPEPEGLDSIWVLERRSLTTGAFYMYSSEITNREYGKFLLENHSDSTLYPDTSLWERYQYAGLTEFYFSHSTTLDLPVTCISFNQAKKYCIWLQDRINLQLHNTNYSAIVDLPSEAEYMSACKFAWNQYHFPSHKWAFSVLTKAIDANVASVLTNRNQLLMNGLGITRYAKYSCDYNGFKNLLGNVSEYTRNSAYYSIFPTKQYSASPPKLGLPNEEEQRIAPMVFPFPDLEFLQNYVIVKGGSFRDNVYFAQPGSVAFIEKHKKELGLGFRPVLKLYKKS